jgi:hypothetical protein
MSSNMAAFEGGKRAAGERVKKQTEVEENPPIL